MWTCKAFDPEKNKTCNTRNPDDAEHCAQCGAMKPAKPPVKPVGAGLLIILPVIALVLCMAVPIIFSLAMRLDFSASVEKGDVTGESEPLFTQDPDDGYISYGIGGPVDVDEDESEDAETLERGLVGAISETHTVTQTTEYKSVFVPTRLAARKSTMVLICILYGPTFITGAPLDLTIAPDRADGLDGDASLRLANFWIPILFAFVYLLFLLIINISMKDKGAPLKFVFAFTIIWLVYSVIFWLMGGIITSGLSDFLNTLLTEEQGGASFDPVRYGFLSAPIRVLITGKIYWVLSILYMRAKAGGTPSGALQAKSGKTKIS